MKDSNCQRTLRAATVLIALLMAGLRISFSQTSPLQEGSATYRVAGSVVSKTDGRRLARARVILADVKDPRKTLTAFSADDGNFEFTGVIAGKYSLEGAKRGFLPGGYDQHGQFSTAIVTGAGLDTENLTLRLSPTAIITGRVSDEAGEAVRHGQVMLYRANQGRGVKQVQTFRGEQTNDLGTYEFTELMPGTYYLSAHAIPWYAVHPSKNGDAGSTQVDPALDVAFPVTYYGDTADAEAATPIVVRDGTRLEIDVHLTPVPALHLMVHLTNAETNVQPDGSLHPMPFPQVKQIGPSGEPGTGMVLGMQTQPVSPGVWEVSGIPAGRYDIFFPGTTGALGRSGTFDLVNDGQEVDASAAALTKLKVSVQVVGQKRVPEGLGVGLRSDRGIGGGWRPIDQSGDQVLEVPPGRYEITVSGTGKAYSIAGISASGCEVSGHRVTVSSGAAAVSLTLVEGTTRVEGVVKQDDKPVAGAMVVLVPKDPSENRSSFRLDQSDLDGTFSLNAVFPGNYTILAIVDGWDLDWSEPEVISAYQKRGQTAEVRNHETRPITLPEPLEAQPK